MRLIDADELIKKFKYSDAHTEDENVWCATFRRMIKEQPTVENKKQVEEVRADERAKVLEKILNSEKFFGNYIDARDLIEWLKAHK